MLPYWFQVDTVAMETTDLNFNLAPDIGFNFVVITEISDNIQQNVYTKYIK